jgi:acyl dehydratase
VAIIVNNLAELNAAVGQEAVSQWHLVTQGAINKFAEVTGDLNPIHLDPEFARQTPFGQTIAQGYYVLSLAPKFISELWEPRGFAFGVLYGFNKVRFPAPLPTSSRIRMRLRLASVEPKPGGALITAELTFEPEAGGKPVCVAEYLARIYGGERD